MTEQLIPIDWILFREPVSAGMSPWVLFGLANYYRGCNEHTTPVLVRRRDPNLYELLDGRHRVVASMIAGRKAVLATVED